MSAVRCAACMQLGGTGNVMLLATNCCGGLHRVQLGVDAGLSHAAVCSKGGVVRPVTARPWSATSGVEAAGSSSSLSINELVGDFRRS